MLKASTQATITYAEEARNYMLVSSTQTIKKGANNTLLPTSVTFESYYRDGKAATRTAYAGRLIIAESTDGSAWTNKYTSTTNQSAYTYTPTASAAMIRCTLYAAGGITIALDVSTIPILTDVSNIQSILDDMTIDTDTKIEQIKQQLSNETSSATAEIKQTQDGLALQASQITTMGDDVIKLQERLSSYLDIDAAAIEISVMDSVKKIDIIDGNVSSILKELQSYFEFGAEGLTVRKSEDGVDSPFALFIDNQKIQFRYNNSIVAYISNNQLFVPDAVVGRLAVGNASQGYFIWQIESNGSMTLKRRANT